MLLNGCATCERYPVACAVGSAVIVGSVLATAEQHGHRDHAPAHTIQFHTCGAGEQCAE